MSGDGTSYSLSGDAVRILAVVESLAAYRPSEALPLACTELAGVSGAYRGFIDRIEHDQLFAKSVRISRRHAVYPT
jgi:hypothetical protein